MSGKNKVFQQIMNKWGKEGKAFFFLIDFEMEKPFICELKNLKKENILLYTSSFNNSHEKKLKLKEDFAIYPVEYKVYKKAFDYVIKEIQYGNSYLVNLTFPSVLKTQNTLKEIFYSARSPYKLFFKDKFVSFSPETFVKISDNTIFSYPMKGTIDASVADAEKVILENEKEKNEHYTIVDLIRNDLSMVSERVRVTKFRFLEEIKTNRKNILQVSSEIQGKLENNWQERIGDIIWKLLPAGSVSGAPKQKTMEIIRNTEMDKRGYYTGIFGIFDGKNLDSAVNIRYIEQNNNRFYYRSGGGITAKSNSKKEYEELIDKIYVPLDGNYKN